MSWRSRRVVKRSMVREGREDEGKETAKTPQIKYRGINQITCTSGDLTLNPDPVPRNTLNPNPLLWITLNPNQSQGKPLALTPYGIIKEKSPTISIRPEMQEIP